MKIPSILSIFLKWRILLLLYSLILLSCKKGHELDCLNSTGKDITEVRFLEPFRKIEIRNHMEVDVYQGNEYKVEVTAGKNIIKNITSKLKGDLLLIENTNTCNFVRGYKRQIKIRVTVPYVAKILNHSVGPVRLNDFVQDSIFIRNENTGDTYVSGKFKQIITSSHGNGDIHVSGSANELSIYMKGSNYLFARNFRATESIYIASFSIADAYLDLTGVKSFAYYAWSDGNIRYVGNPQSITNLGEGISKGKGQLIKED